MPVANEAKRVKRRNKEQRTDAQGGRIATMFQEFSPRGRAENSSKSLKSPQFKLTWYLGVAQLVARYLGVVEAASSSLVTQTISSVHNRFRLWTLDIFLLMLTFGLNIELL